MKSIFRFIIIILLGLSVYFSKDQISAFLSTHVNEQKNSAAQVIDALPSSNNDNKKISAPAPLQVKNTSLLSAGNTTDLNSNEIIGYINTERENAGLGALTTNPKLNQSAELKLKDMIAKQYFDHVSPDQKGISDLGDEVGYKYIIMGENLAYGDFRDDKSLVEAWMESPLHRANILNPKYSETGLAVGKGNFKGKITWIAVQHFGKPLTGCPEIDQDIKLTIEKNNHQIEVLGADLGMQNGGAATVFMAQVFKSGKIKEYNNLIKENQKLTAEYNDQVLAFNQCIKA